MRLLYTLFFLISFTVCKAQKVDSIYVNLYTDSLKKGTYNYINVDGLMEGGYYLPMDTNHIVLTASDGKFYGNNLYLEPDFDKACVDIAVCLKTDIKQEHKFRMYIKTKPDDEHLPTNEEILDDLKKAKKKKTKA